MMNNFMVVGRLATEYVKGEVDGKECTQIKLAVPRSYKNEEGIYETDFIPMILLGKIAENTMEYCKKGDVIGARGSIHTSKDKKKLYLAVDKITFLSSNPDLKKTEDEEDDD